MQFSVAVILSALAATTLAAPQFGEWNHNKGVDHGFGGDNHGSSGHSSSGHGSSGSGRSSNDHVIFEITSESEATSSVTVYLGHGVTLHETATAIAASEVIVEQVGSAICTIAIAESEASVTDTITEGWRKEFSATSEASSTVTSISCDYPSGH
ncbi:hypothetical protein NA57DRAFT_55236 [Rhizodiscina lignyota]|uniref:Uncharacterized protein n=1 Tax=Rhizodiscina lignyota TaxID=1504668 RepID=A0A9P4ICX3_9PEZI|nr:hypothetical protein NA57DRAFT_55236 [Rhizodiscina lignyota]